METGPTEACAIMALYGTRDILCNDIGGGLSFGIKDYACRTALW